MHGKWAETRAARELHDLNLTFLGLLRKGDADRPGFGLEADTWRQLFGLSAGQLEVIARMPCLLAGFTGRAVRCAGGVAEAAPLHATQARTQPLRRAAGHDRAVAASAHPLRTLVTHSPLGAEAHARGPAPDPQPQERLAAELRLYAVALLTWLWQTARRDRLLAILCTGPDGVELAQLGDLGFNEIQRAGASAGSLLGARFSRHPRLWPDLLRAARSGDRDLIVATQLSVIQLTLVERRQGVHGSVRRTELRNGRPPALRTIRSPDAPG